MFHLSLVIQSLGVVKFSTKIVEYTRKDGGIVLHMRLLLAKLLKRRHMSANKLLLTVVSLQQNTLFIARERVF